MLQTTGLSESAVATLHFQVKGRNTPVREIDLPGFRELVAAGIMEEIPDANGLPEFRFTEEGMAQREEILRSESDRIERERFEPPDAGNLSDAARELVRRLADGKRVAVTPETKPIYRELAAARIMYPVSGFIGGPEANFRFTYWGWHRRDEWIARPTGSP